MSFIRVLGDPPWTSERIAENRAFRVKKERYWAIPSRREEADCEDETGHYIDDVMKRCRCGNFTRSLLRLHLAKNDIERFKAMSDWTDEFNPRSSVAEVKALIAAGHHVEDLEEHWGSNNVTIRARP